MMLGLKKEMGGKAWEASRSGREDRRPAPSPRRMSICGSSMMVVYDTSEVWGSGEGAGSGSLVVMLIAVVESDIPNQLR